MNDRDISLAGHGATSCEIAHVGTVSDSTQNIRDLAAKFSQARSDTRDIYFKVVETAKLGAVSVALKENAPDYEPKAKRTSEYYSRWDWFKDFIGGISGDRLGAIPLLAVQRIADHTAKRIEADGELVDSLITICEDEAAKYQDKPDTRIQFEQAHDSLLELRDSVHRLHDTALAISESSMASA